MNILLIFSLLLWSFISFGRTQHICGVSGTLAERIIDCSSEIQTSSNIILVTRISDKGRAIEVYVDSDSGLIWSDVLAQKMSFLEASTMCKKHLVEQGGLTDLKWRLPTKDEFEAANVSGVLYVLPRGMLTYWSSSTLRSGLSQENPDTFKYVRCVSNPREDINF
ncbi:MAG: hypothetical protein AB7I27_18075 [Bacteriovoracaceae bacterium]